MIERGVTDNQIRSTLLMPDRIERDKDDPDLLHAVKRFFRTGGSRALRVIYNPSVSPWRIVTMFFERARRRR
jgi:hypothetical protein